LPAQHTFKNAPLHAFLRLNAGLAPKRLQLLRELIPNATLFGVVADPAASATQSTITGLQAAARTLGLKLVVVDARTDSDLETAFATLSQQDVGAVLVGPSALYTRASGSAYAALPQHKGKAIDRAG
jgi:putative ABC transport system substrate-binding protein